MFVDAVQAILPRFVIVVWRAKAAESTPMKHWLRIADHLRNTGFSWGCSCESDSTGRVLFTADAYAPDGALLFWQVTDLLHLSNYTRPFIVKLKPDEVLGNHR